MQEALLEMVKKEKTNEVILKYMHRDFGVQWR